MKASKLLRLSLFAIPLALAFSLVWDDSAKAAINASIFCEAVSTNGGVCEARPQGEGFTYLWSTTGSAFLPTPAPPTAAVRQAACIPFLPLTGSVRVTVVAPDGSTSSASVTVCTPPPDDGEIRLPL